MIKVKEGETGIGGSTRTIEGEYCNNSGVRRQSPQTVLWLRDSNVVGNLRIFKGIVSTAATLVQDTIFSCLYYCNLPLTFPALALSPAVLSQHSYSSVHTVLSLPPHSEHKLNSSLESVRAALLGSHYRWLHPVLCAYLFSPLHKAAIPAVPQTCSCLRGLAWAWSSLNIFRVNSSTSFRSLLKCPLIK